MNVQIRLKKSSKEINSNKCCYCKVRRAITIMGAIEKERKNDCAPYYLFSSHWHENIVFSRQFVDI